jgi:predicted aconitase
MYLSKWEERAFQGEFGEAIQLAMNVVVKVCKALKGEKLVEIAHAHVSGVSYFNIGDEGLQLLEDIVKKNAKTLVYTTANPASIVIVKEFTDKYDYTIIAKQMKIMKLLLAMGIDEKSFTCIPYKLRTPRYREHLAWAESSAVIYANSILGARTNREGGIMALMASIAGRTCFCGMHLDDERNPTEVIEVEFPVDSIAIASALGLYIGNITGGVPYIKMNLKIREQLKNVALKSMLSSIASTSSSALALLEGISPEVNRVDRSSLEKISIDYHEIKNFIGSKCSNNLLLGCPHVDVEEAKEILMEIKSKLKNYDIERIFIALPEFEVYSLQHLHLPNQLTDVEVVYLPGVCPIVSNLKSIEIQSLCTLHGKAYHYLPRLSGVQACLLNIA